jgi:hypothetical protein
MRFARRQRHSLTTCSAPAGGAEAGGNSTTCYLPPHVASKSRAARGEAKRGKERNGRASAQSISPKREFARCDPRIAGRRRTASGQAMASEEACRAAEVMQGFCRFSCLTLRERESAHQNRPVVPTLVGTAARAPGALGSFSLPAVNGAIPHRKQAITAAPPLRQPAPTRFARLSHGRERNAFG